MVAVGPPGGAPSIQELLAGIDFPISREALLDALLQNGAPATLLEPIQNAAQTRFGSAQEVIAVVRGA